MIRKIIASVLCICLLSSSFSYKVYAAEYEKRQLTIKCLNNNDINTYDVLVSAAEVYIALDDLNHMVGFSEAAIDEKNGEITSYFMLNERYMHENNVDYVIIYPQEQKIISPLYGEKKLKDCLTIDGTLYLNLIEIFNYLRIKAVIEEDEVWINLPIYSFFDFLVNDYRDVLKHCVSQLDLLKNGEGTGSSNFWDTLSLACNHFDFKLLVPGWGSTELRDEQYIKAIESLNEEDEIFYNSDTEANIQKALTDRGFGGVLASGKDLANVMDIGGSSAELIEDVILNLSVSDEKISEYMDLINWEGKNFDGLMQMQAWSKQADKLSDAVDIGNLFVSSYETYKRASGWNEECLNDIKVLMNLDASNYVEKEKYVERIIKNAERCYEESIHKTEAVANQAVYDVCSLMLEKIVTEILPVGKVIDYFVLAVNTGVSVARCFGNAAEEMDKAELSYMVNCFINIAVASRIDAEVKYCEIDVFDMDSEDIIDFRNSLRTYIKSNLRCWSYIYYVNRDGEWEKTDKALEVKNKIDIMKMYLTILNESEQYDYALDDHDLTTFSSKELKDILKEKKDESTAVSELIQKYGIFKAEQLGVMQSWEDAWFDGSGLMSVTVLDFDQDGLDEMLVCIGEKCNHSSMDSYHIKTEMYDIDGENIILKDTSILGAYFESKRTDETLNEIYLSPNLWSETNVSVNVVLIEGEYYIVCECQSVSSAFANGSECSYWVLQYKNDKIQYVGSFTQTDGGSSGFRYTGYSFEHGKCVESDLYYSEWLEDSALYENFGEALSAFFADHHINLREDVNERTYVFENREDVQSILADNHEKIRVFDFCSKITNSNYEYGMYEFEAELITQNDLSGLSNEDNHNPGITESDTLLGMWYTEGYNTIEAWAVSYKTLFNADGSVVNEGYKNKDMGIYKVLEDGTILATYNENYVDVPGEGYQPLDYTYTVTYRYNPESNTLFAEYDEAFQNECMSNASSGVLYR